MATASRDGRQWTRWPRPARPATPARAPSLTAARVGGLALLLWAVSTEVPPGASPRQLAVWVLSGTLVPAWLLWTTSRASPSLLQVAAFAWLAAAGGALCGLAPMGLVFVGTAALGAAAALEMPVVLAIAGSGPAAAAIAVGVDGRSADVVLGAAAACLAGLVIGAGRRQHSERAAQAVLLALEQDRAQVEHDRGALLAERNRLAGEVHDVLAHTLGALSVQLEALDAQLDGPHGTPSSIRARVRHARSLASEGLAEARRAVRALRDDATPLTAQLDRLTSTSGASLHVMGDPDPLPTEMTLALYRVAQEAITNATKHAPGARVEVRLEPGPGEVTLSIENGPPKEPPGELASSGAGYGLDGITERVRLVGGEVTAGPTSSGWRVVARVPT